MFCLIESTPMHFYRTTVKFLLHCSQLSKQRLRVVAARLELALLLRSNKPVIPVHVHEHAVPVQ